MLSIFFGWYKALLINLLTVSLFIGAYYSLRHLLLPFLKRTGNTTLFIAGLVASILLLYATYFAGWTYWLTDILENKKPSFKNPYIALIIIVRFYSPSVALLALESLYLKKLEQKQKQQLKKDILANELKYLKAKVNPQFLFNTLNNLYIHVVEKSPKVPDMILRLSNMLDYILYKSQQSTVPLNEEIQAIKHFLALEKIRHPSLSISFNCNGDKTMVISPLILLSLLEHVFKYQVLPNSTITLDINESTEKLTILIVIDSNNKSNILVDKTKKDTDFQLIKRQLELIYPNRFLLKSTPEKTELNLFLTANS